MSKLENGFCLDCKKPIKVPMVLPYNGKEDPTGMPAYYMDEDGIEEYIGCVCFECAFKKYNVGYAGFPHSWDAVIFPSSVTKVNRDGNVSEEP